MEGEGRKVECGQEEPSDWDEQIVKMVRNHMISPSKLRKYIREHSRKVAKAREAMSQS